MLIIPHVRELDNGEYCCIASNGIGEPAKSCGALQLKMSTSAFCLRLSWSWVQIYFFCLLNCSWSNSIKNKAITVVYRQKTKPVLSLLFCLCFAIRATNQTPSYQFNPSGRIQSSAALRYPWQPQTRCHLAQGWWAYKSIFFFLFLFFSLRFTTTGRHWKLFCLTSTGNGCRLQKTFRVCINYYRIAQMLLSLIFKTITMWRKKKREKKSS